MKKYFVVILLMGLLFSFSCKKEEKTVLGEVTPPVLSSSATGSIILSEADSAQVFSDFTWTEAKTDVDIVKYYALTADKVGNNFADAHTFYLGDALSYNITVKDLNGILAAEGYEPGVEHAIEFRVSVVISGMEPVHSNLIQMKLTPYEVQINYPFIYVPGEYQGWKPENATTVLYSVGLNDSYEGYLYFEDAFAQGFKFTDAPNWDSEEHIFGDQDAGGTTGILANPGNNILAAAAEAGYYKINADLDAMTYSVVKTEWGIFGAATQNADIRMTYDDVTNPKTFWSVTTDLVAGEFTFRANNEDVLFYGDADGNMELEENAGSITVPEDGNYTITLDLTNAIYTYSITKN